MSSPSRLPVRSTSGNFRVQRKPLPHDHNLGIEQLDEYTNVPSPMRGSGTSHTHTFSWTEGPQVLIGKNMSAAAASFAPTEPDASLAPAPRVLDVTKASNELDGASSGSTDSLHTALRSPGNSDFLSPFSVRVVGAKTNDARSAVIESEDDIGDVSVVIAPRIRRPVQTPLLEPVVSSQMVQTFTVGDVTLHGGGDGYQQQQATASDAPLIRPPLTPGIDAIGDTLTSEVSKLSKLQSYLPTGTWITWAFSIKAPPHSDDPHKQSNCNSDQRIALIVVMSLCAAAATIAPFIKTFVLDAKGERIVYPPPYGACVPYTVRDRVTGATFPYCLANGRWVWPVTGSNGGWIRQGDCVRVFEFKEGREVKVYHETRRGCWAWLRGSKKVVAAGAGALIRQQDDDLDGQDSGFGVPQAEPRWKFALHSPYNQYLSFDWQVLKVRKVSTFRSFCLYPSLPDYVPGVAQTGALALISFLAAYVVDDQSVSFGQLTYSADDVHETSAKRVFMYKTAPGVEKAAALGYSIAEYSFKVEVPVGLQEIVQRVIWVRARPLSLVVGLSSGGPNAGKGAAKSEDQRYLGDKLGRAV
ncbi:hypothetical protein BKA62DRAFT_756184 [Auriculariales sp. MPI-PUGE-AT-0066]|nr:hypothetical protein BKA62DRAFT_756184 [Auriculariales sp. MPI-PUGE-AT-0066]